MTAAVFRRKGESHTAIVVAESKTAVQYIEMEDVQKLAKADPRAFHLEWEQMTNYPVRRAAELYLGTAQYREMSPQVRDRLERIVADPATEFDPESINVNPKEPTMATAQTAPKKTAPTKPAAAPAKTAPTKAAAPAKTAPVKAAPVKTAPAKAAAPAAKTAPAKTAPAKTAPTGDRRQGDRRNGMDTVVAQATKSKAAAPAAAKAGAVARPVNDEKLKVADPAKANRGETAEYVEAAKSLKSFTRQELHDVMVKKGKDSKKARIKIADCVYFKVFTKA